MYYCTDEWSQFRGVDRDTTVAMEQRLLRKVDLCFATSPTLVASKAEYERLYRQSLEHPELFWREASTGLVWRKPWATFRSGEGGASLQATNRTNSPSALKLPSPTTLLKIEPLRKDMGSIMQRRLP